MTELAHGHGIPHAYETEESHERTAGKGKPRHNAPDVARRAEEPSAGQSGSMAPDSGGRDDGGVAREALRPLVEHPKVASDVKKLPKEIQSAYHSRVDSLRRGESHPSTHALGGPFKGSGWQATRLNFQYRMVHKHIGDELHVLSAGNHDETYEMGARRMGKTAAIRMVPPEEYRKFAYPDYYPKARTPNSLAAHFKKTSPEYYEKAKKDVQENGFSTPALARWKDNRGNPLKRPIMMDGHHRAAIAHELGIHLPVGDYDDNEDYQAASEAGREWFKENQRPTDDMVRHGAYWMPTQRLFGPTYGLDHRLFDEKHELRTDVRKYILETLNSFWKPRYGLSWDQWARVYFAGSEASEWTSPTLEGNNDFDILIGVDYDKYRANGSRKDAGKTDLQITDELNEGFRKGLMPRTQPVWIPVKLDEWHHQPPSHQNSLQNSSSDIGTIPPPLLPASPASMVSKSARYADISNSREYPEDERTGVRNRISRAESVEQQKGLYSGFAGPAGSPGSGSTPFEVGMDSRRSNSQKSLRSKEGAAASVGGMTSASRLITTTDAAPGLGHAGSVSEGSSARDATRPSLTSVNPIFAPRSNGWTAESPPPAPEGWVYIGPFDNTFFINPHSYDIRDIRPYAAYDVTNNRWAVKPPHLPEWNTKSFPEGKGLEREIRGILDMAKGILAMPEPYRTQNGKALWEFVHSNRSDAFGPQGEGWYDPRNVIEKALDQAGLMQQLWAVMDNARKNPHLLDSPTGWSNNPGR